MATVTANYTASAPAIVGQLNYTTPTHVRLNAGRSAIVLRVTGTEFKFIYNDTDDSNPALKKWLYSIDGGAWTAFSSPTPNNWIVFTGLSEATRTVALRPGAAYGDGNGIPLTGNVFEATGSAPAIVPFQFENMSAVTAKSFTTSNIAITASADLTPRGTCTSPIAAIAVKGDLSVLAMIADVNPNNDASPPFLRLLAYMAEGDAQPTYINPLALGQNGAVKEYSVAGLSGEKIYHVWCAANVLAAGGIGTMSNITAKRLDQFGTSITNAGSANDPAYSEVFPVGMDLGCLGGNHGVSGSTIGDWYNTILDAALLGKTVTSADVAVVELGTNDPALDSTRIAQMHDIFTRLLAKGYGKILVRGLLPAWPSNTPNADNPNYAAMVASYANANVIYINVNSWINIDRVDGLHPSLTGYETMRTYATPAYQAALVSSTVYNETLTESAASGQTFATAVTFPNTLSQSAAAGQTFANTVIFPNALAQGAVAGQTFATAHTMPNALSQAVAASDSVSNGSVFNETLSQSALAGQAFLAASIFGHALTEQVGTNDNHAAAATYRPALTESTSVNASFSDGSTPSIWTPIPPAPGIWTQL